MNIIKPSLIYFLLVVNTESSAQLSIPGFSMLKENPLRATDNRLAETGLSVNEDDIVGDQDTNKLTLNEKELHEASVWGLTLDEEKRYVQLMQNRSRLYYQGLHQTPIDVLGINARSELERDHFATLAARQEAQKVAKNIAWNNAFSKAYNELFKDIPVVGDMDVSPYSPYHYKPVDLNVSDTLYLFIKPNDAVKTVLLTLCDALNTIPSTRLHIMLLGIDDVGIQTWANTHQIPPEMVAAQQIILNHGELPFEALTVKKKKTPLLLLARNGVSHQVDLGRF